MRFLFDLSRFRQRLRVARLSGRRVTLFGATVLSLAGFYLLMKLVLPYFSMWVTGSSAPHPVPSTLFLIYALLFLVGTVIYITSSGNRLEGFLQPVRAFLLREGTGRFGLIRKTVLIAIPLLMGGWIFLAGAPKVQSPTSIRIQHPTMPGKFEGLQNPFRLAGPTPQPGLGAGGDPPDAAAFLKEGTVLYEKNCRPCHGVAAGGDGPMARFFRLRPANFRDPGFIATVVEAYAFWRVSEGGPGLPPAATPWDSAMPIWKFDLTEEERWKVLLAVYAIAGVEPRKPEKLE
jgi:mono/diheme cytochrome c family protein